MTSATYNWGMSYKDYNNYSERDKQSIAISKVDDVIEAVENLPSGGGSTSPLTYEIDENGAIAMTGTTFKMPSAAKTCSQDMCFAYVANSNSNVTSVDFNNLETIGGTKTFYSTFELAKNITSFRAPKLSSVSGTEYALGRAFLGCTSLKSVDLSALETASGKETFFWAFNQCTSLESVDLSSLTTIDGSGDTFDETFKLCTALKTVDISSLKEINAYRGLEDTFSGCTSLESLSFDGLESIKGNYALSGLCYGCTSMKSLSFPSLTTVSYQYTFNGMLSGVTGCTVHFPAALESTIGSWSSVTSGFSGTDTTVLFDL